jgi:hypothetical protein
VDFLECLVVSTVCIGSEKIVQQLGKGCLVVSTEERPSGAFVAATIVFASIQFQFHFSKQTGISSVSEICIQFLFCKHTGI